MTIGPAKDCIILDGKFPCRGHVPIDGMPKDGDLKKVPSGDWTWFEIEHAIFCILPGWLRSVVLKR